MTPEKIIEDTMGKIMDCQAHQRGFLAAETAARNGDHNLKFDRGVFHALMERELKLWRGLLMWGLVADHKTQERLRAAAHERFLADDMDVREWFSMGGESSWLTATEEDFRAMARKHFQPTP